ncbi:MAG: amidohydrolase [Planctomycetes bacterium]|nr:amidohydrolase [Planctomycetota bacterium]
MASPTEIRALVQEALGDLVKIRRHLHQHPESAFEEVNTAALIRDELKKLAIPFEAGFAGGTGTVAHLAGAEPGAQSIGLRADIDALPMPDQTPCDWRSKVEGRAHACGHDGHTVMLLGAARVLSRLARQSPLPNPVTFLFQPAEETGMGAERMVADGALDGSRIGSAVRRIYGMHAWPTLDVGCVASRPGPMLASADSFECVIQGRGGHAAWPHLTADPVIAAASIVQALQTIVSREIDPLDAAVVTVSALNAGGAFNVIPPTATLRGTTRALRQPVREHVNRRVHAICEGIAATLGVSATVRFLPGTPATFNDAETFERFERVARAGLGADRVRSMASPVMGAEDFSEYGVAAKACFFILGQKRPNQAFPPLHDPAFDFNDDSIATGVEMFCHLALDRA